MIIKVICDLHDAAFSTQKTYKTASQPAIDMEEAQQQKQQQKHMQLQMMQQQMEELNRYLEGLNEQNAELDISIQALRELEKTPLNTEVLAPIANGIFIKSELKDNLKLVVNVGSGVTVERTVLEVTKLLVEQKAAVLQNKLEVENLLQQINNEAMKTYQEMQSKEAEQ
jgi:prefoldin alpha subunit